MTVLEDVGMFRVVKTEADSRCQGRILKQQIMKDPSSSNAAEGQLQHPGSFKFYKAKSFIQQIFQGCPHVSLVRLNLPIIL